MVEMEELNNSMNGGLKKKKVVKKKSRTIFGVGGAKKGGKVSEGVKFVARQYGGKIGN